jgi:hypothetical protein
MPTYRARSCPNCNYYFGFTVAHSRLKRTEAPVNGVCLNCGYKIPMRAVVLGAKKAPLQPKRRLTRSGFAPRAAQKPKGPLSAETKTELGAASSSHLYAVALRAIGQQLETLQHNKFNLECRDGAYLVWARKEIPETTETTSLPEKKLSLKKFWKRISGADFGLRQVAADRQSSLFSHRKPYRYDQADIDRIDRAGKAKRQPGIGITDGHSLSQLLRTLGTLISERGQTLLAISWQEISISVVVETPHGERQLDLYRHDNLYDFWVKCYLRRAGRAYSDIPT